MNAVIAASNAADDNACPCHLSDKTNRLLVKREAVRFCISNINRRFKWISTEEGVSRPRRWVRTMRLHFRSRMIGFSSDMLFEASFSFVFILVMPQRLYRLLPIAFCSLPSSLGERKLPSVHKGLKSTLPLSGAESSDSSRLWSENYRQRMRYRLFQEFRPLPK